jgi:hypothetical protein
MLEPRRPLGEGAGQEAPTAPHATVRQRGGKRTGPERFWARWPARIALGASLLVSGAVHCSVVPLEMPHHFEVNEVEGEAAIPIDALEPEDTPPPPPPPPPPPEAKPSEEDKARDLAAAMARHRDAGSTSDADVADAAGDASVDAPPDALDDAPADAPPDAVADAMADAGAVGGGLDGAIALADAAPSASGPRDPQAILGAAGNIQAAPVLVMVVVNAEVIRTHPLAAEMGSLLRGIEQWDDFMRGTTFDPVRDVDWVMISGPSLVNTSRDVILVRYSASDAAVDKAVDIVSRKHEHGGAFDAGVPGVRASRAFADRAERIILRPQSKVLALVPPDVAEKVARQLAPPTHVAAHVRPGEAAYVRLVNPHHPFPEIPASVSEARMRVVPRADHGADVFIEGDTKDSAAATQAADDLRELIQRYKLLAMLLVGDLLDHIEVTADGNRVHVHLAATLEQIETVFHLFARARRPAPSP